MIYSQKITLRKPLLLRAAKINNMASLLYNKNLVYKTQDELRYRCCGKSGIIDMSDTFGSTRNHSEENRGLPTRGRIPKRLLIPEKKKVHRGGSHHTKR
jgi:hypothetical protein